MAWWWWWWWWFNEHGTDADEGYICLVLNARSISHLRESWDAGSPAMHAPQRSTFPYRESSARDKCLLDYHPLLLVEGLRVLPGEVLPVSAHFTFKSQSTIVCFYPVWGEIGASGASVPTLGGSRGTTTSRKVGRRRVGVLGPTSLRTLP